MARVSRGQRPAPQVSSWLRGERYDRILYIPGHEGCRSRKSEISEIIRDFDILWSDSEQEDSCEFHSQSGGSICRGGGGGGGRGGGTGENKQHSNQEQRTGSLGSSAVGAGRSQKSARSGGDDSGNTSRKKRSTRPVSTPEHQLQCPIYARSDLSKRHRCESLFFGDFQSMLEHLLRIHIKPLQCAYCWNRFGRSSERTRHQREACWRTRNRNPILVENRVPDYVLAFSKDIMGSTRDTLGGILYSGGRKQYDFLDNTDELYISGMTHSSFPDIPVNDQIPQLPSGQNVFSNRNTFQNRNPSFAPSPAPHAATRSDTHYPPPASNEAVPENYSGIRRSSTLLTSEEALSQVPARNAPSLISTNLSDSTSCWRGFLNRVEQEFKLAEQAGLARQLAQQVAARTPQNMLVYMAEYQPMATPSGIRSVMDYGGSSYPEGVSLDGTSLEDFDLLKTEV